MYKYKCNCPSVVGKKGSDLKSCALGGTWYQTIDEEALVFATFYKATSFTPPSSASTKH